METHNGELAALIGSRICHDLISPIGAINNGLELLDLTGASTGPEMELISESVGNADARIRFFRIAFGAASDQLLGAGDVRTILDAMSKSGRITYHWDIETTLARSLVRLAFLAIQCCETAMHHGGTIAIITDDTTVVVKGQGVKVLLNEAIWTSLSHDSRPLANMTPASVQFALLPMYAKDLQRRIRVHSTPDNVSIMF
jgi:histidine phosphotransferase ChpT